jgi:pimeloyl-ACP methyl ester carboxylesterase
MAGLYALSCPERLQKIVLLTPANTIHMIRPEFALRAVACLLPFRLLTKSFIYWLFSDLVAKDEAGKHIANEMVAEMVLSFRCFQHMPVLTPTILTDAELLNFKVPTLFLLGEHEKIYSAQAAVQRIHRLAPQWKAEILPSAGHDLTFTQAKMVNKKTVDFFLESDSN